MNRLVTMALLCLATGCNSGPTSADKYFSGQPVSYWLEAMRNGNSIERKKAADVLGNVGAADPAAIPALILAVKDPDAKVRDAAVLALAKIGPPAKDAESALEAARADADPKVREHVALALDRIRGLK